MPSRRQTGQFYTILCNVISVIGAMVTAVHLTEQKLIMALVLKEAWVSLFMNIPFVKQFGLSILALL